MMAAVNLVTGGDSSSACSSPRLSFSHDLSETNISQTQQEVDVGRLDMSLLSANHQNCDDFNFCVTAAFSETENSPADELFFNGVIIPIQMKEKLNSINKDEEITSTTTATLVRQEKTQSKSFWRFSRSSSLNCENFSNKRSSSSGWSLPLLLRSKSTGSSSNHIVKQTPKNPGSNNGKLMNNNNTHNLKFSSASCKKPPLLRKSGSGGNGSHGNGVRNSSTLNVPPPYITKGTSDLLGFGSFFRNGSKEKKTKK